MRTNVCTVLVSCVPRVHNASLACRDNSIAEGLKNAGKAALMQLANWPAHFVHYRKLECETSNEPDAVGEDQGTTDSPSDSVGLDQAEADSQRNVSPSGSRAAVSLIDKVPVCISFRIGGSGAQPMTKTIMKAALFTLCFRTFSLSNVQESDTYTLVPATRNQNLGFPSELLVPVYTGPASTLPRTINRSDVGFKPSSKGKFQIYRVMSETLSTTNV